MEPKDGLEGAADVPIVLLNNTDDNMHIVICLSKLAEGTGYRKAIDAMLDCVEIGNEFDTETETDTDHMNGRDKTHSITLESMLAKILDTDYEREEVAFRLIEMVACGERFWANEYLEKATTLGHARNVALFMEVDDWPFCSDDGSLSQGEDD